jgi:hypothetical protein
MPRKHGPGLFPWSICGVPSLDCRRYIQISGHSLAQRALDCQAAMSFDGLAG